GSFVVGLIGICCNNIMSDRAWSLSVICERFKDSLGLALTVDLAVPRCENVAIALVFADTTGISSSCKVPQLEQAGHFPYICGKS
ncbi:MAG: hypothetical protein ACOYMQ_15555, partial [Pseudanabaena sp.]